MWARVKQQPDSFVVNITKAQAVGRVPSRYIFSIKDAARGILSIVASPKNPVVLNVFICDNGTISKLNSKWFGRLLPTNVISFRTPHMSRLIREFGPVKIERKAADRWFSRFRVGSKGAYEIFIGDIALGIDRAVEEARIAGVRPSKWIAQLVAHGIFHLLGYVHRNMPDIGFP